MSAYDLLHELQSAPTGAPLDWRGIRERIHDEAGRTRVVEERVLLLEIFKTVMDAVESSIASSDDDVEAFKTVRGQDYKLLLMPEILIGQHVSVELAYAVTQREIDAGRMTSDNGLRSIAVTAMAAPYQSVAELIEIEKRRGVSVLRRQVEVA